MGVLKVIKNRFSVRKFKDQPVEPEKLEHILEAAKAAPTAKNLQPQRIFVCKGKVALAAIDSATKCRYGAPTVLVVCYDQNEVWHNPFDPTIDSGEIDASIVADEMILAAWDEGIASCWVAHFNPKKINSGLKIQEHIRPVVLIPIGYAEDGVEPALRHTESKDLDEIVHEL